MGGGSRNYLVVFGWGNSSSPKDGERVNAASIFAISKIILDIHTVFGKTREAADLFKSELSEGKYNIAAELLVAPQDKISGMIRRSGMGDGGVGALAVEFHGDFDYSYYDEADLDTLDYCSADSSQRSRR